MICKILKTKQHLYFVSDKIEIGDTIIIVDATVAVVQNVRNTLLGTIVSYMHNDKLMASHIMVAKKIEASTDKTLGVPLIPELFQDAYCPEIKEVGVYLTKDGMVVASPNIKMQEILKARNERAEKEKLNILNEFKKKWNITTIQSECETLVIDYNNIFLTIEK